MAMATTNAQDEARTTEAHALPDENPDPTPSEEHLNLDHPTGYPTPDILESPYLAQEHPITEHPEEQPRSNNAEEHPEPKVSKSIEELLRDFEKCQKQQLQILRTIAHKTTNTSQHAAVEPTLPRSAQKPVRVSPGDRELIQNWNNRQNQQREPREAFGPLIEAIYGDSEIRESIIPIELCMKNMPGASESRLIPDFVPLQNVMRLLLDNFHVPCREIDDIWKIQYRLEDTGWARAEIPKNRDSIHNSTVDNPICARIIHDPREYRRLSVRRTFQIISQFVDFPARPEDQGELSSHVMKFILGYAMEWKVLKWRNFCGGDVNTLQFNFRFFEIPLDNQKSDIERIKRQPGRSPPSELLREIGNIPLPRRTGPTISERRASVFMAYGRRMNTPYWTIFNFSGRNFSREDDREMREGREYFHDGTFHFQTWYSLLNVELENGVIAWQKILSEMDVSISLKVEELCDPQILAELMRDGNYSKRSEFYFVSFSMLRRFADCVEETLEDLKDCCQEVNGRLEEDDTSENGKEKIQEISRRLLEARGGDFQDLLRQIQNKIDTIMPLQESLFNSTSIREASEATRQGRYIFIFTIMTIVYLPLGFVTSLFGMNNITENSPLVTSTAPFAVTFSVIAAVTYLIASGSFPFANSTKFRPMLAPIWKSFRHLSEKTQNKQQLERVFPNFDWESNNNPDSLRPSPKSRALKRIFSFFQLRRSQPAEASRDV